MQLHGCACAPQPSTAAATDWNVRERLSGAERSAERVRVCACVGVCVCVGVCCAHRGGGKPSAPLIRLLWRSAFGWGAYFDRTAGAGESGSLSSRARDARSRRSRHGRSHAHAGNTQLEPSNAYHMCFTTHVCSWFVVKNVDPRDAFAAQAAAAAAA